MENPEHDIPRVLELLTSSKTPTVLRKTIEKFYAPDASLRHPLSVIKHGPNSRDRLVGVYEWYRILSPDTVATINELVYDHEKNVMYIDISQTFKLRLVPFPVRPSRLITRLKFTKQDEHFYIKEQEDLFHPDDLMKYCFPPLAPLVTLLLQVIAFAALLGSNIYVRFSVIYLAIFGMGNDVRKDRVKEAVEGVQDFAVGGDVETEEGLKKTQYGHW
ncbi:hypothetical protein ID866_6372 [Astraeus odoratus]|nr:hypothetical protein ID866_6372 [Astraeus odoratus]